MNTTPINPQTKKILIIDDEINGILLSTAHAEGEELFKELQDLTSPITEEVISVIRRYFSPYVNFIEDQEFSLDLIKNVFFNPSFLEKVSPDVQNLIQPIFDKNKLFIKISETIQGAFPVTGYELVLLENNTQASTLDISSFDLLILDWYLGPTITNEAYIRDILSKINNLPPIILLTSHSKIDTPSERSRFFESTKISGAGLITLTKDKLISEEFNSLGLLRIATTLMSQRFIANDIREYIKDWENALEIAKTKTLETLWQLDTFILKTIQEDAFIDGQPYHDHFHNFIQKENSWHIEDVLKETNSIENLGEKLKNLEYKNILTHATTPNSFSLHRTLLSHYSFKGYNKVLKVSSKSIVELEKSILHDIPFGAVLKEKSIIDPVKNIYINITQPCDLSDIVRSSKRSDRSIQMIKMEPTKKGLHESAIFDTTNYIITDFRINDEFYDLKPLPMSIISLNFEDFYKFSCEKDLHVIGEVRNDIAVGLQQKAVSYLIRPSQQRTQRPSISPAKVIYLKHCETGENNPRGFPIFDHFKVEYEAPTNIVGTKDQVTTKQYIQLVGLDHFELTNWIISNIQDKSIKREELINFFYEQIEMDNKSFDKFDKKIGSLTIKFLKNNTHQSFEDEITKLRIDKNSECIFILHQAHHL